MNLNELLLCGETVTKLDLKYSLCELYKRPESPLFFLISGLVCFFYSALEQEFSRLFKVWLLFQSSPCT